MVRTFYGAIAAGALSLFTACVQTIDPYEEGERSHLPRPGELPAIVSVEILDNGAWTASVSGDESRDVCMRFRLDVPDVQEFFQGAVRVSQRAYTHDLDMSRCHVTGRATLQGGGTAQWQIDRERRGRLSLSNGTNYYFHCGACTSGVFGEP